MKDRETGKSRGFGFVTFETEEAVEQVIANLKEHKLLGKWVECKKATPSNKSVPSKPSMTSSHMPRMPTQYSMPKYAGYQSGPDYYSPSPYTSRPTASPLPRFTSNPFVTDYSGNSYQQPYYPNSGSYGQYPPPKMGNTYQNIP